MGLRSSIIGVHMRIFNLKKLSQNTEKNEPLSEQPQSAQSPSPIDTPKADTKTEPTATPTPQTTPTPQPKDLQPPQNVPLKKPIEILGQDFSLGWPMLKIAGVSDAHAKILLTLANKFVVYIKSKNNNVAPPYAVINGKESIDRILQVESRSDGSTIISVALQIKEFFSKFIEQLEKPSLGYDASALKSYIQTDEQLKNAKFYIVAKDKFSSQLKNTRQYANVISMQVVTDDLKYVPNQVKKNIEKLIDTVIKVSDRLTQTNAMFDSEENAWLFFVPNADIVNSLNKLREIADLLAANNYDVTNFERKLDEFEQERKGKTEEVDYDPNKIVYAETAWDSSKFHIAIRQNYTTADEELQELIRTFFPSKGVDRDLRKSNVIDEKPEGMHILSKDGFHYIYGDINQYFMFMSRLRKTNWEISELQRIVADLSGQNIIEKTRINGQLEGYEQRTHKGAIKYDSETGLPIPDSAKFDKAARDASTADLYSAQVDGVKYLYQYSSAILGDKTGTGKTLQTLVAAKMRAEHEGKPVLIFTLKSVVLQWANEIRNKLREPAESVLVCDASIDENIYADDFIVSRIPSPEQLQNVKYVLLSYPRLTAQLMRSEDGDLKTNAEGLPLVSSKRKSVEQILHAILKTDFAAIIMDEAHTIKNPKAAISQMLGIITKDIPFKWAASATTIANTPIDILNILRLNGHVLGNLTQEQFEQRYVGPKLKISDFRSEQLAESIIRQKIEKAQSLQRALITSGAYISRSKEDIRPDMPKHEINANYLDDSEAQFDMEAFVAAVEDLKIKYGQNVLPLLSTQRRMIAERKVSATVAKAKEIYETEGSKVLIFSNYVDVCNSIEANLKTYLAEQDPEGYFDLRVAKIIGDSSLAELNAAVQGFKSMDNMKFMVISSKKGGTGISLEDTATHVIMNDFDWSPSIVEQTEGRAYRVTNTQGVNTHYMVLKSSSNEYKNPDEIWYEYLRRKIAIASAIQNLESKQNQEIAAGLTNLATTDALVQLQKDDAEAEMTVMEETNQAMIANGGTAIFTDSEDIDGGTKVADAIDAANDLGIDLDDVDGLARLVQNRGLTDIDVDVNNNRRAQKTDGWYKYLSSRNNNV